MKIMTGGLIVLFAAMALSACGSYSYNKSYCLEEQESNGFDYMVVADHAVCDNPNADAEWFSTDELLRNGDIAYVEVDGSHSSSKTRRKDEIKKISTPPPYTPATKAPGICLKAYAPAPPKPAPNPKPAQPAPAPIQQPAPRPANPAPNQNKAPIPVPAPQNTNKPGC